MVGMGKSNDLLVYPKKACFLGDFQVTSWFPEKIQKSFDLIPMVGSWLIFTRWREGSARDPKAASIDISSSQRQHKRYFICELRLRWESVKRRHDWLGWAKSLASDRHVLISIAMGRGCPRPFHSRSHHVRRSWGLHQGNLQDLTDLEDHKSQAEIPADGHQKQLHSCTTNCWLT